MSPSLPRRVSCQLRPGTLLLGLLAAALLPGCTEAPTGGGTQVATHKVQGVVKFKGQPVAGAHVSFHPEGDQPSAFAKTSDDGSYSLQTYAPGDGAAAGTYQVTIQKTEAVAPAAGGPDLFKQMEQNAQSGKKPETSGPPKALIPEKFASPKTSELKAQVAAGENKFDYDLTD